MRWVVQLLYPALLGWNQWAWDNRRYNASAGGGRGGAVPGVDADGQAVTEVRLQPGLDWVEGRRGPGGIGGARSAAVAVFNTPHITPPAPPTHPSNLSHPAHPSYPRPSGAASPRCRRQPALRGQHGGAQHLQALRPRPKVLRRGRGDSGERHGQQPDVCAQLSRVALQQFSNGSLTALERLSFVCQVRARVRRQAGAVRHCRGPPAAVRLPPATSRARAL
jgi:hypothetical protein